MEIPSPTNRIFSPDSAREKIVMQTDHFNGASQIQKKKEAKGQHHGRLHCHSTAKSAFYVRNRLTDFLGEDYLDGSPLRQGSGGLRLWEEFFALLRNSLCEPVNPRA